MPTLPITQTARSAEERSPDVEAALPPDGEAGQVRVISGLHPGDRYLRIKRRRDFRRVGSGYLVPRADPNSRKKGALEKPWRFLIGRRLATAEEPHERVNVFTGLSVFASDNISSSAYASEEIMRVLALAGAGALALTLPITLAIVLVLAIVVMSYQQTIAAYPNGGGSYIVSSDNLGRLPALISAAALLTDYVLTVSVSIAAGVAALTSIAPALFEYRVLAGIAFVTLLCIGNLRGIRESAALFTAPAYVYLVAMFGLLAWGLCLFVTGQLPTYSPPADWQAPEAGEALGLLLILRAFASGSVALTGTEAVSNGVPAFKPPEAHHAQWVLILMGVFFGSIFISISFLSGQLGILPDPSEQETVISQLTRMLVGEGTPYHYLIQLSTALLLVLAANTAFADFPRLSSILARDQFLPRLFAFRGDRLAFSGGIVLLAVIAAALIVAFEGSVTNLIPLYTVGVFLAFTLSQSGMVRHWWLLRGEVSGWWWRASFNGVGAVATGIVAVVVAIVKFALGAWMVLLLIPLLVGMMWMIHRHYQQIHGSQRPETPIDPADVHLRAIIPIAALNLPARQALAFAQGIAGANAVTAVFVTDKPEEAGELRAAWERLPHVLARLVILESPYRELASPLLAYVDLERETHPNDTIVVVLPEFVPAHWWEHLLHNQTALRLKAALLFHPGVIVASVPYHLATTAA